MTDEKKLEIALSRAKKLVKGDLYTAKAKHPSCVLCRKKIERGQKYYRAGDLASHCRCADRLATSSIDN